MGPSQVDHSLHVQVTQTPMVICSHCSAASPIIDPFHDFLGSSRFPPSLEKKKSINLVLRFDAWYIKINRKWMATLLQSPFNLAHKDNGKRKSTEQAKLWVIHLLIERDELRMDLYQLRGSS